MSAENLKLMTEIDRQFLDTPFYGVQQMRWHLRAKGRMVNVTRVRRLMRLMGFMPIYRQPRTTIPAKGHKRYPYLLKGMKIGWPNQVWCADITYIPLAKRHLRRYNGIPKHHFHLYLKECEWRFNYRPTANLLKVLTQWANM